VTRLQALFVDDDPAIRKTFTALLELEGFEVLALASAREATAVLAVRDFDLVVTDMRMETPLAGYDVVRAARNLPSSPEIIILTAYPLQTSDWKQQGAYALFMKGGNMGSLLSTIRDLADRRRATRKDPDDPPPDIRRKISMN